MLCFQLFVYIIWIIIALLSGNCIFDDAKKLSVFSSFFHSEQRMVAEIE